MRPRAQLTITLVLMLAAGVAFFVAPVSAIDEQVTLEPAGDSNYHFFSFANTTERSEQRFASTHIVLFKDPRIISFISENRCSVYLINESLLGVYLVNGTILPQHSWTNVTSINEPFSYDLLRNTYGLETRITQDDDGNDVENVRFYFIVVNEVDEKNRYSLRVAYENEFKVFMEDFFRIVIAAAFFTLFVALIRISWKEKKKGSEIKAHVYRNYGLGFFFGFLPTGIWEIYHWYIRLVPEFNWNNPFRFQGTPIPGFSENVLSFISILSLGLALAFMSNTVEKTIQQRKVPFLTYILMALELVNVVFGIVGYFDPAMIGILTYTLLAWIVSLALVAVNLMWTYLKIARTTTGKIKSQAINTILSLAVTFLVLALGRVYVQPELLANVVGTFSAIWLYKSVLMS